ncbi:MAG: hypothetical protein ACRDZ4_16310, partial [Egibacteraceae bacterium]
MTGDGGAPIFRRAYDGGAGEASQVTGAMEALRELAGQRKFLMVGDSKLVSYPNLAAIIAAGVEFVAPASKTYVDTATLAAQDLEAAVPVDHVAQRDEAEPAQARGSWRVVEDTMTLAGKRKADRVLTPRRALVRPSARAVATTRPAKKPRAPDGDRPNTARQGLPASPNRRWRGRQPHPVLELVRHECRRLCDVEDCVAECNAVQEMEVAGPPEPLCRGRLQT